ncbi:DUF4870 domain-containing protein [Blastopirellula marina]|uniref:DUF4870 domain-containing protein n=1 Tax=Blastopirellula marina TaxID=124 RepID=A0A2S8FXN7_9BACT|nr:MULTISPECIES: DUF4870 domain-containing protein [Pirellulaceae]PQO36935.1 DUF4870 domain-containing protein [Blastopirellula marina]RCS53650.1 DUF4870 domain-containing protein [Bremerella cremea]
MMSSDFSNPYEPGDSEEVTQDDRNMALLCHILGLLTNVFGPLILWILMKDKSAFVDFHGKQAINFQITLILAYMASGVLMCVYVGILLAMATFAIQVIFTILPAMKAYEGQRYVIPVAIPFLR